MTKSKQTAFKFPCTFPMKVIGKDGERFEVAIIAIVRKHVPSLRDDAVESRPSGNGTYRSLTATFTAESQEQLDALYLELNNHDHVIMVL